MLVPVTSPWPTNKLWKVLKFIWSIPTGLIGLLIAAVIYGCCRTQSAEIDNGALDIIVGGKLGNYMYTKGWRAFTFGWTILYWGINSYSLQARVHERVHIKQYSNLGIMFPFVYMYYNLTHGYKKNPLELEAYKLSGEIHDIT